MKLLKDELKYREELAAAITKHRKEIGINSVSTYVSALSALSKMTLKEPIKDLKFLNDYDNIVKTLASQKITTQKNRLTAIIVALDSQDEPPTKLIERYQAKLKTLSETYLKFLKTQKKTTSQAENWLSYQQLLDIQAQLYREIKFRKVRTQKPEDLSLNDFKLLQKYVLLSTYIQIPVRNDFADMKVLTQSRYDETENTEDNNYIVKTESGYEFKFNIFKNSKRMGEHTATASKELIKILKLWFKFNTSGYFIVMTDRKKPVSPNGLTKLLNSLFKKYSDGKKVSSSMIRHIVISHESKDEPTIKEVEDNDKKVENKFLHSAKINKLYRKLD